MQQIASELSRLIDPILADDSFAVPKSARPNHLITFAPTGTGKTSGPVIINALKHPGQLIVLDMKVTFSRRLRRPGAQWARRYARSIFATAVRRSEAVRTRNPLRPYLIGDRGAVARIAVPDL